MRLRDPAEPPCDGGDHEWRAPHEIVGGLKENPGVWGHGGGVSGTEVCVRCGCGRHWAREQGLSFARYEPGEFRGKLGLPFGDRRPPEDED